MSIDAMEARMKILEDERELRELLTFYSIAADLGMREDYIQLFTEDGVIEHDTSTAPPGRFEGREQISSFINGPAHAAIEGLCQHHAVCGTIIFYVDGDEAVAEGYSLNIVRTEEDSKLVGRGSVAFPVFNIAMAAFNQWRFRRVDGRWRISGRRARPAGHAEIATTLSRSVARMNAPR